MRSKTDRGEGVLHRVVIGIAVLCASFCMLALGASSALADRTFDSIITPFNGPTAVAFDANGNVWISDRGQLNNPPWTGEASTNTTPTPRRRCSTSPIPTTLWQYYSLGIQLAVDQSTSEVFVTQSNGRTVDIFVRDDGHFLREWSSHQRYSWPVRYSRRHRQQQHLLARPGLSLTGSPEDDVEVLDAAQRPVDFPPPPATSTATYSPARPAAPFGDVQNITVDSNGNIYVTDAGNGVVDEFDSTGTFLRTFPNTGGVGVDPTNGNVVISGGIRPPLLPSSTPWAIFLRRSPTTTMVPCRRRQPRRRPQRLPLLASIVGSIDIFSPNVVVPAVTYKPPTSPTTTSATLNANVDPNGGGDITACHFEYGTDASYGTSVTCSPDPSGAHFSSPTDVSAAISGLTRPIRPTTTGSSSPTPTAPSTAPTRPTRTGKVRGPQHRPRNECHRIGRNAQRLLRRRRHRHPPTTSNGARRPPTAIRPQRRPAMTPARPRARLAPPLSTDLSGLDPYSTYHYRVVATNGSGTTDGQDQMFTTPPGVPLGARRRGHRRALRPGDLPRPGQPERRRHARSTSNTSTTRPSSRAAGPNAKVTSSRGRDRDEQALPGASQLVDGLSPGTLYHYRAVGTNQQGSGSDAATFRTFAFIPSFNDPCPNAHVRQQTGAALLLDCRAYELVSAQTPAAMTSSRTWSPGQTPFGGYPRRRRAHPGPLRRPQRRHPRHRQPDQQRRRPLRRDPRRRRLDDQIRRHPGQQPQRHRPLLLDPGRSRRRPRHLRLRRARHLLALLRRRHDRRSRSTCPTAASSRAWRARWTPAPRPNRRASSASTSPPTAPTSSSARPRSSSPTATERRHLDLRPRPEQRHNPRRLQDPGRRRR